MAEPKPLTVMSANLWNLNAPLQPRMRQFSDIIDSYRPDVVAMQEVRPLPGSISGLQLDLVPALANYRIHYSVAASWSGGAEGLAIATRAAAEEVRTYHLPDGEPEFEPTRAVQYVRIPWGDRRLGILNTHLAYHPSSTTLRFSQAQFVGALVHELGVADPDEALVVCGDLNATPDSPPVARLLELGGLTNPWLQLSRSRSSFAASNPYVGDDPVGDSWLDYILTRGAVVTRLKLIDDWSGGASSDHYFVMAEIAPRQAPRHDGGAD
ncbi:Metal-dependent hydrolase, endonuclease/exonuclease/phosphatase family [Tessaracoccus bendigoensis DSM 12906]|uniref:Metal-dependent hydrolase, endonuclease/exonuclease/phosphatase family n=1 Tax=Tessaracoccus bendigoensis DSM 12906 TaxID=1123357 RepID=A0A1M6I5H3_9ACTN|nr:endonuclease/exonuclease/phosphatase family protein [Tessaracoccus bendigoensis]SHJ29716.1 Metal-dependent hydrolase, endonuclease/exonuclease/phosphatase family [Tessaracoccus bendigoensis DSM 12906]